MLLKTYLVVDRIKTIYGSGSKELPEIRDL